MAQGPELLTSDHPIFPGRPRQLALAKILSALFSPPLTIIASYILVLLNSGDTILTNLKWAVLSISIQLIPVSLLYGWRLSRGDYRDADVSNRKDRNELYLLGSLSVLVTIALLIAMHAPAEFVALAVGTLVIGICFGLVNMFWKISMHAAGVASLTAVSFIYTSVGLLMVALVIAVAWARVRTRNHTFSQVLAGATLAGILMYTSFRLIVLS